MDLRQSTNLLQFNDKDVVAILGKYNKTLENLVQDIGIVQDWMKKQKHFPISLSERQITYCLIIQGFNLERAKNAINMYFTLKTVIPGYYAYGPKDQQLINQMNNYNFMPLPKLSSNLNRIMVSQAKENTDFFDIKLYMNVLLLLLEAVSFADVSNGLEYIIDFRFASNYLLDQITSEEIQKLFFIIEKVYFDRIVALHVLTSERTGKFMDIFRNNIKPNMQKKIKAHSSYEALHEYYTKDMLPKDYGGNLKSIQEYNDDWKQYLQDNNDLLVKFIKAKSIETLRDDKHIDPDVVKFDQTFERHLEL